MKILIFILNLLDHLCLWIYILHLNFLTYWTVLCRVCPNNLLNFIGFHCDILFFISSCVILNPLSLASLNKVLLLIFRFLKNPLIVLYILYIDSYFINLFPDHYFFLFMFNCSWFWRPWNELIKLLESYLIFVYFSICAYNLLS